MEGEVVVDAILTISTSYEREKACSRTREGYWNLDSKI